MRSGKRPLPYSLRVSFEHGGETVFGHIVRTSLVGGVYYYDVLDSEDTLANGTLYEQVPEGEIEEEELWEYTELPYKTTERWNPEMPWWQPDVRCCECEGWSSSRFTMKMGDGRQMCPECAKQYLQNHFWSHDRVGGK